MATNRGVDRKGRSKHDESFIAIPRSLMRSAAYISLSANARAVLLELVYAYNGRNNGSIRFGVRATSTRSGLSKSSIALGLCELTKRGFVAVTRQGSFHQKGGLASEYRLTWRPSGTHQATPPTRDYEAWKPSQGASSSRQQKKKPVPPAGPDRPVSGTVDHASATSLSRRLDPAGTSEAAPRSRRVDTSNLAMPTTAGVARPEPQQPSLPFDQPPPTNVVPLRLSS
jgi:hypothetical protein